MFKKDIYSITYIVDIFTRMLRSKMKDKWDQINKPACPTTCSHCWGFLGVIGRRDEVPQLLCFFHAEFCIGRPKNLSLSFFSTHTHTPGHTPLLPVFFCVFTDRQQGLQTQSLDRLPNGWITSPWKQPLTKTEWRHAEDRVDSDLMQQVYQTFTGSTCFLLKTAINHFTKQWRAEHTDVESVNMEVQSCEIMLKM